MICGNLQFVITLLNVFGPCFVNELGALELGGPLSAVSFASAHLALRALAKDVLLLWVVLGCKLILYGTSDLILESGV
jgi:hypothetical protein